ncbi:hypothetical protein BIU82_13815 [Arthrobacter sp. SW1]|nr:hypothetical protein BIU82_13815 [Arthrobacter sp. SW1]
MWAIAAVVVAVITIGVMFYLDRKRNPRREFAYEVTASPLVSSKIRGLDKLAVSYDGSPLAHPYLVTVRMASTGRADISSTSFDGNKPVIIELNVPILGEIEQSTSMETVGARLKYASGETSLVLPPSLLPKGFSIHGSYLCDGIPQIESRIELADITIRNTSRASSDSFERVSSSLSVWSRAVSFGAMAVTGVIAAWTLVRP